jgi:hypothetical protein
MGHAQRAEHEPQGRVPEGHGGVSGPSPVVQFRRALRDDRSLHATTKLVLYMLAEHYPDIRPSYPTIAAEMGMCGRTAMRHVGKAIKAGWLVLDQRGNGRGNANVYHLCIPEKGVMVSPFSCKSGVASQAKRVTSTTVKGDTMYTPRSKEEDGFSAVAPNRPLEVHTGLVFRTEDGDKIEIEDWEQSTEHWSCRTWSDRGENWTHRDGCWYASIPQSYIHQMMDWGLWELVTTSGDG